MTAELQLVAFVVACVCIAIFLASLASAGFRHKGKHLESQMLFLICVALVFSNMVITMHLPVLTFSMAVGMAGWILATILNSVFGLSADCRVVTTTAEVAKQPTS